MSLRARPSLDVRVQRRLRRAAVRARLTDSVTRNATGMVVRGSVRLVEDACVLSLPKRLESPNLWLWTHWRTKSAAKKAWAEVIARAVCDSLDRPTIAAFSTPARAIAWTAPEWRARVTVQRRVRRRSHFLVDRDNRVFAAKGLADCLVQAGFLRDDAETAIDLDVTQDVSADGLDWTVITIAPIPAAPGA